MAPTAKSPPDGADEGSVRRTGLSRDKIREVALARFAHQGYHATSLREIATDLGVTVAALYYHYDNKDELLTQVLETGVNADFEAIAVIRARTEGPILDELIRMHVLRHIEFRDEALVVQQESKYLPKPYSHRVRSLLREYEAIFRDTIVLECEIPPDRVTMVTKVVLGMGAAVIHWFHPTALMTSDEVADRYVGYARSILETETTATRTS